MQEHVFQGGRRNADRLHATREGFDQVGYQAVRVRIFESYFALDDFYLTLELLPLPELIVRLKTDEETVAGRLSRRRRINIANADDTALFNSYLDEWLTTIPSNQILELDVTKETLQYSHSVNIILDTIKQTF